MPIDGIVPQHLLAYLNFSFLFFCMTEALLDLGNAADFHGFGVDSTYRDDQKDVSKVS